MKTASCLAVMLLLSTLTLKPAHAFRCQYGNLVLEGDSAFEVKQRCGEPTLKEFVGFKKLHNRYVRIDRYFYIPSSGSFLRILEMHDGRVSRIHRGQRVE